MKKSLIVIGLLATIGTAGVIAHAQEHDGPPHKGMMFEMLDANKDGTVTRAEASAAATRKFDEVDTNRDGVISQAERDAARQKMTDEHFRKMDADGNGQISLEEFRTAHQKMHEEMRGHGDGPMMSGDIKKADALAKADEMFDRVDANKDGKITTAERDAAMAHMMGRHGGGHHGHGPDGPDGPDGHDRH